MRMPTGSRITVTNSRYGSGGIRHFLTKRALGDFCSLGQVGAATMRTPVVFIVHRRLTHRQQFRETMLGPTWIDFALSSSYAGVAKSTKHLPRDMLSPEEIRGWAAALEAESTLKLINLGHKRTKLWPSYASDSIQGRWQRISRLDFSRTQYYLS